MSTAKTNPHWEFALTQALYRLSELVYGFDMNAELYGQNFTGVQDPETLLTIIKGFLDEQDMFLAGQITRLEGMRTAIQQEVAPAYQAGQAAARQVWMDAPPQERARLARLEAEGVINEAWKHVPHKLPASAANWFLEGFCRIWWTVEFLAYIRGTPDTGNYESS